MHAFSEAMSVRLIFAPRKEKRGGNSVGRRRKVPFGRRTPKKGEGRQKRGYQGGEKCAQVG